MSVYRMKFAVGWLLALVACQGCSTLSEYQSEWALKHRAHQVYKSAAHSVPQGPLSRHYERGWKRGYCDVAEGGNGSPPPLPPEVYWSFKYQNPAGQIAIETWFEAYHDGAQMALADGVQQFNYLPSPHLPLPMHQPSHEPAGQPSHKSGNPLIAPPTVPGEIVPPPLAAQSAPLSPSDPDVHLVPPPRKMTSSYTELPEPLSAAPTSSIDKAQNVAEKLDAESSTSNANPIQTASYYSPDSN